MTEQDGFEKIVQERFKSWRETEQTRIAPKREDRLVIVQGLKHYLFDEKEMPYLDFTAGQGTLPLGHSYPGTTSSLTDASKSFFNTGGWGVHAHAEQMEYVHWLGKHFPEDSRFVFTESENEAIRLVAETLKCHRFVNRRTLPMGMKSSGLNPADLIVSPIDPDTFEVLSDDQLREVWKAHEAGARVAWDTSVTGFGWTGDMFRYPDYVDYVILGGAIGAGMPLGGIVTLNGFTNPYPAVREDRSGAFGGNSLPFAAGRMTFHAVSKLLERGDYIYLAEKIEHELVQLLEQFPKDYLEMTGLGLLRGVVCRDKKFAVAVREQCKKQGALLAGTGNVIRVVVPLNYQKEDLEELASILLESTMEVRKRDG